MIALDIAEVAVGLLFLQGAWWKFAHVGEFRTIMRRQAGFVARWSGPLGVVVPAGELLIGGVAVVAGLMAIAPPVAQAAFAVQAAFAAVLLAHTLQQRRSGSRARCGCLNGTETFGTATVVRGVFVLAVSLAVLIFPADGAKDLLATLAGAAVIYLIVAVGLSAIFWTSPKP
ncbi:MauE/DoxX family redox-associated membrane protein [Nonomuraea turcica]|uniref:MauE/DoxX family redox-associated membrane protein n=1 Tax=Nonomuraea sp. G32 TaxID=3067274 RepID=UPI00273CC4D9|nr:MauE/DoxX family redox-associated membrane protein [Nonomuraea sp. G32]MDP4506853.1 MauE/DoxX family redox-associated membrane protein [Nonomuraea sp. G32]